MQEVCTAILNALNYPTVVAHQADCGYEHDVIEALYRPYYIANHSRSLWSSQWWNCLTNPHYVSVPPVIFGLSLQLHPFSLSFFNDVDGMLSDEWSLKWIDILFVAMTALLIMYFHSNFLHGSRTPSRGVLQPRITRSSSFFAKLHLIKMLLVLVIFVAVVSAETPQCVLLKHASSALVDCERKTAKIFSEPFCKSAHIVTIGSDYNVDAAVLDSLSFLDLFHTACSRRIAENSVLGRLEHGKLSSAAHMAFRPDNQSTHGVVSTKNSIPVNHIASSVADHDFTSASHAFRMANLHIFKEFIPNVGDYSIHDSEAVNHLDASSLPQGPWRRSLLLDPSFPAGCSIFFNSSSSLVDDDDEDDDDETSRSESFPLSVHCSFANLTEISPTLLQPTAVYL